MQKIIKMDFMTSTLFTLTLSFYIIVTLFNIPWLPVMGKYLFIAFMLILFVLIQNLKIISLKEFIFFFPFIVFTAVYLFNLNGFSDSGGLMIIINQLAYLMITYVIYTVKWSKLQIQSLSYLYYISLPILLILVVVVPGMINRNTAGSFAFFLSFFPLLYLIGYSKNLKKSRIFVIFMLMLAMIFITDSRSILLSMSVGVITFSLWKVISSRKIIFRLYFFLVLALNYFIIVVYPKLYTWSNFYELNSISYKITGKPIMTGRNTIWAQLLDIISFKPWLGYGSSIVPENFLSTSLSAHNLYLQIGLQTGLIGIGLLLLFFYSVWKSFRRNHKDPKVALAASFFIGIVVHQTFEVTLTQNQFSIGLLQWIIIGFGLNYAMNKKNYDKTEPN